MTQIFYPLSGDLDTVIGRFTLRFDEVFERITLAFGRLSSRHRRSVTERDTLGGTAFALGHLQGLSGRSDGMSGFASRCSRREWKNRL
jgi:ribosome modulation factor